MTQTSKNTRERLTGKFAIGRTADGFVNVTSFGKHGETVTKTIPLDEARALAILILQAAE